MTDWIWGFSENLTKQIKKTQLEIISLEQNSDFSGINILTELVKQYSKRIIEVV